MNDALHDEALEALEKIFGDRMKRRSIEEVGPDTEDALALVLPMSAEEIEQLVQVAARFDVPLVAQGAGTAPHIAMQPGSILVRFDLMGDIRFPEPHEFWVEAEAGARWLELDNNLRARGQGLAVYPTSAPRATVGGWLTLDGLGVGSFEYGWLSENVLSADVVLLGDGRRTVKGEDLRSVLGEGDTGLVVGARLRTRQADNDVPFGILFDTPEDLAGAIVDIVGASVPLWHLAFVSPEMSRARGLGEDYLLFGVYPRERAPSVEEALRSVPRTRMGSMITTGDAYRVWGERFFPVAPSHPTPSPERALVPLAELARVLGDTQGRPEDAAIQGTVARSGEVLLLTFDAREEGWGW